MMSTDRIERLRQQVLEAACGPDIADIEIYRTGVVDGPDEAPGKAAMRAARRVAFVRISNSAVIADHFLAVGVVTIPPASRFVDDLPELPAPLLRDLVLLHEATHAAAARRFTFRGIQIWLARLALLLAALATAALPIAEARNPQWVAYILYKLAIATMCALLISMWFRSSRAYAREEIVAEIGAVMMGLMLGLIHQVPGRSLAYIRGWLHTTKEADRPRVVAAAFEEARARCRILLA